MNDRFIHIVILDGHELVRAGLQMLLDNQPEMQVIGEAGSINSGLELVSKLKPDVILLDLNFGAEPSSHVVSQLLSASNCSRIILIPGMNNPITIQNAIESGAVGVVSKIQSPEILFKAILKVYQGEVWLERSMIANVLSRLSRIDKGQKNGTDIDNIGCLSDREKEIIGLIGQGYKNKKIAEQLFISETTVRHHLTTIYNKLGVSDRLELLVFAHRFGLVKSTHS